MLAFRGDLESIGAGGGTRSPRVGGGAQRELPGQLHRVGEGTDTVRHGMSAGAGLSKWPERPPVAEALSTGSGPRLVASGGPRSVVAAAILTGWCVAAGWLRRGNEADGTSSPRP